MDFKQEVSQQVLEGLPTDLASFANVEGGIIVFGVTNKEMPEGILLEQKHREWISQRAQQCSPPVTIDFTAIPFGKKGYLVVHVPESKAVHSDHEHRFPFRIGDTTGYMDSLSLLQLMQRRGLVMAEAVQEAFRMEERKRTPLSTDEEDALAQHLGSASATVRSEALRDLATLPYRHIILENPRIAEAVKEILVSRSSTEEEVRHSLQTIRGLIHSGTEREKQVISQWFERIVEIARAPSAGAGIAREAFEVLQYSGRKEAVEIMVGWVRDADEERFAALRPADMLSNIKFYGLHVPALNAMYALIEGSPDERTRKRVSEVLEALRRSYG